MEILSSVFLGNVVIACYGVVVIAYYVNKMDNLYRLWACLDDSLSVSFIVYCDRLNLI